MLHAWTGHHFRAPGAGCERQDAEKPDALGLRGPPVLVFFFFSDRVRIFNPDFQDPKTRSFAVRCVSRAPMSETELHLFRRAVVLPAGVLYIMAARNAAVLPKLISSSNCAAAAAAAEAAAPKAALLLEVHDSAGMDLGGGLRLMRAAAC